MRPSAVFVAGTLFFVGCGGGAGAGHAVTPNELTAAQIDADPMALLPASPVAVANVDARAFYSSGSVGASLASITEKVIPIGDECGFKASRDVDRVVAATYSTEGADVVAVVSGRFDEAKITEAAASHASAKGGGTISQNEYAGHHVFTMNAAGFAILTPKTALVGTQDAIRRALDRVHDGKTKRDLAPWMQDTLATPDAAAAVAVDFSQPVAKAAIGSFSIAFAKGLKMVRAVADFKPPGMHLAGTLTYDDAPTASSAANGMKQAVTMEGLVALTGLAPKLRDVQVNAADANVQVSLAIDEQAMKKLLAILPQVLH